MNRAFTSTEEGKQARAASSQEDDRRCLGHGVRDDAYFGTPISRELLRNGVSRPEAKQLARYSDVNMAIRYTHSIIGDQAKVVANLPSAEHAVQPTESALQMRCIFGGAEGHSVSLDGNQPTDQKRQNPRSRKGFDVDRRSLATNGKVEAAGIEPASRDMSMGASTRVVGSFTRLACRPLTDEVPGRPAGNGF